MFDNALRDSILQIVEGLLFHASGPTRMLSIQLLLCLLARHCNLVGIDLMQSDI